VRLAAELARLESLIPTLGLSESSWHMLMAELERARDAASRCRVLERWFAGTQRAYAANEALIGHYVRAVEARAAARAPPQNGPHSIAPWLRNR